MRGVKPYIRTILLHTNAAHWHRVCRRHQPDQCLLSDGPDSKQLWFPSLPGRLWVRRARTDDDHDQLVRFRRQHRATGDDMGFRPISRFFDQQNGRLEPGGIVHLHWRGTAGIALVGARDQHDVCLQHGRGFGHQLLFRRHAGGDECLQPAGPENKRDARRHQARGQTIYSRDFVAPKCGPLASFMPTAPA
jgi:hypothetical protein